MKVAEKHFKFINSKTGYVIYYYTLKEHLDDADTKAMLEKIKADVASKNSLFLDTIYWEEEKA
ncbi:hypothetical protein FO440_19865 [Mucilaginibacter corticis]|uniref:DUF695 domain-containing protein n=1 Tax=Mucilaginibacter corticis TaxID=2597670 RepID=A0A556MFT6_9SPHI|nr:hypothetical protein [Mucilaginibacter corticis]TSJ38763.1 hypothetical protein FO440_19865 [Mucilaginibacter corticis]